ncbi:hypothetical protein FA15DRAFT_655858 [Coprinopsis marcescibilis]|uniref:Uncharacterized protein n=1 Tax=Coprinopsis marcescibilis TaxID=230819 RepID=A0A5C3KVI0_COPMA|nr:hypothetical protein FA15DRAFT_655858 [Coprinopsis marcescibilis]
MPPRRTTRQAALSSEPGVTAPTSSVANAPPTASGASKPSMAKAKDCSPPKALADSQEPAPAPAPPTKPAQPQGRKAATSKARPNVGGASALADAEAPILPPPLANQGQEAPKTPGRKKRRTREEIDAANAEKQRVREAKAREREEKAKEKEAEKRAKMKEKEEAEQHKAALRQKWEDFDRADHARTAASNAAIVHNLADTGLMLSQLDESDGEDFTKELENVSVDSSEADFYAEEVQRLGAKPKPANPEPEVTAEDIQRQIDALKLTSGRSNREQRHFVSDHNPEHRLPSSHAAPLVVQEIGGLRDEDADGELPSPSGNNVFYSTGILTNPGAPPGLRRQNMDVTIKEDVFGSTPSIFSAPHSQGFGYQPAQYQPAQAFTPVFTPPPLPVHQHHPQPAPAPYIDMNTRAYGAHGPYAQLIQAFPQAMQPTVNFPPLGPAYQQHRATRSTQDTVAHLATHQKKKMGATAQRAPQGPRRDQLPQFVLNNNRWTTNFLPTIFHTLFTSPEPFKGFVSKTPKLQEKVQRAVNRVYPEVTFTVQLEDDAILQMACNRLNEKKSAIAMEAVKLIKNHLATFRSLSEAANWLVWAQSFYGPLYWQNPTPAHMPQDPQYSRFVWPTGRLKSPFIIALARKALVSVQGAILYPGEEETLPVGLFGLILTSLERAAEILDTTGEFKVGANGSTKVPKFSDENWGPKLEISIEDLQGISAGKWAEIMEYCMPAQVNPTLPARGVIVDLERRRNRFTFNESPTKAF